MHCWVYKALAIIGENLALVIVLHALSPALANAAHFLSEDSIIPGLDWLEFHHEEGTKAKAIERVMKQLGANRLVVFGDNNNDLPMFRIADESYAVSNAIPAVLAAATGVIGSNDSDAVARWVTDDLSRS